MKKDIEPHIQEKILALQLERQKLEERIKAGRVFLGSSEAEKTDYREIEALSYQLSNMENYSWMLHKRIKLLEEPNVDHTTRRMYD